MSVAREWVFRLVLLSASLLVALVAAELVVRVVMPISDGRDNVALDGTPIKSWFEPGSVYRQVSNEYNALTTITPAGHRVPGTTGNPDVVFLGDSFTYGWGLSDEETFASIYCTALNARCANLGVPGTGTAKQLDRLEEFIRVNGWRPREVKLFFFGMSSAWSAGNDFVDNYDERGLADRRASSSSVEPQPAAQTHRSVGLAERAISLQSAVLQRSNLMRVVKYYWGPMLKSVIVPDPGNERFAIALHYTKLDFERFERISRAVGFDYTIYVIVPVHDVMLNSYSKTEHELQGVSSRPIVGTGELFVDHPQQYYYAYDGHINARGSRKIADFLIDRDRLKGAFN